MGEICDCYGFYGACLYNYGNSSFCFANIPTIDITGCLTGAGYYAFLSACEVAGCTSSQCNIGGVTTSTSGGQCQTQDVDNCVNAYQQCVSGITDMGVICDCYGAYGICLNAIGCFAGDGYNEFIQACENAGCSASSCGGSSTESKPMLLQSGSGGFIPNNIQMNLNN